MPPPTPVPSSPCPLKNKLHYLGDSTVSMNLASGFLCGHLCSPSTSSKEVSKVCTYQMGQRPRKSHTLSPKITTISDVATSLRLRLTTPSFRSSQMYCETFSRLSLCKTVFFVIVNLTSNLIIIVKTASKPCLPYRCISFHLSSIFLRPFLSSASSRCS